MKEKLQDGVSTGGSRKGTSLVFASSLTNRLAEVLYAPVCHSYFKELQLLRELLYRQSQDLPLGKRSDAPICGSELTASCQKSASYEGGINAVRDDVITTGMNANHVLPH
ncbi:Protein of unknown function [Gryllus bimaculatus]|nr:Protein of unknown function [Gryllus bimaculatus]